VRLVALCAVIVAIAQSAVAPSVIDATGALSVLIAGIGLVWIADLWESRRARPAEAAPPTSGRVTREFGQPALIGALVWVLAADPPIWQTLLAAAVALAAPAAALALVRLAQSGTAPADGSP
jgi:hypothetical protein